MSLLEPGYAAPRVGASRSNAALLASFILAIFTSAFLLFSVQPMFAKMVLPLLGGSPGVWSIAMVVFQALLLAGYAYAHFLTRSLGLRNAALVHGALYGATMLALPIGVSAFMGEPPAEGQEFWLIGVFLTSVGLPFFAVAANGPLLQAWFSRSSHPTASDPYYLYGASNLGSFASLLLYPVAIEPLLALKAQSSVWAVGFVVLMGLILTAAWLASANPAEASAVPPLRKDAAEAGTMREKLTWIALSFVPSALLVAVTAHLSTDIAAAPFLWVAPLAIYLATFVVVFRDKPLFKMSRLETALPVIGSLVAFSFVFPAGNIQIMLALHIGFFAAATLVCHAQLYAARPAAERLTSFYLWMSFGGVLGGIFCGLIAPVIFNKVSEYPLLIAASLVCVPAIFRSNPRQWLAQAAPVLAVAGVVSAILLVDSKLISADIKPPILFIALLIGLLAFKLPLVSASACVGLLAITSSAFNDIESHRSFFGVHKVFVSADGQYRNLSHGTTLHGSIMIKDASGAALPARPVPTTYYHPVGPMAEALRSVQARGTAQNYAVVGLGAGSFVCNGRENDRWSYYEIDSTVVQLATDPKLFRFLSACAPDTRIVLGDARLTLAKETQKFDTLVVDAFSSDAIPAHLMTREALAMYLDKITPDGLLVMHISNRHLELESVLAATLQPLGATGLAKYKQQTPEELAKLSIAPSRVVAISRSPAALAQLKADGWRTIEAGTTAPWTDDYSNIVGAMMRTYAD